MKYSAKFKKGPDATFEMKLDATFEKEPDAAFEMKLDATFETEPEERYTDIGLVKHVDDTDATETNNTVATSYLNPLYDRGEATL